MILEVVKKEFEKELSKLALDRTLKIQEEDRRYQVELKEMERDHQKVLLRLRGQELETHNEVSKNEWRILEEGRKHEQEMEEIDRKNMIEEKHLRDKNMRLFKENLDLKCILDGKEIVHLQDMMNQKMNLHSSIENRETKKEKMKTAASEIDMKWIDIKDIYNNMKMILESNQNGLTSDGKEDILEQIKGLMEKKQKLNKHLMAAKGALGKWKPVAEKSDFEKVQSDLDNLSTEKLEEMITELRKTIKLNKKPETRFMNKMDTIVSNYNVLMDNFSRNQVNLML